MCFRAIALRKAGRDADSRAAWGRFSPPPRPRRDTAMNPLVRVADPRLPPLEVESILPRHRFTAEAFVSLGMAADGVEFFRREVGEAGSDIDRLSAATALCQLLLLIDRKAEYAECVVDQLLPLSRRLLANTATSGVSMQSVAWTLLPMASAEFSDRLPEPWVRRVCESAAAWPPGGDDVDFVCQLVLRTCGARLGERAMVGRADTRLRGTPRGCPVEPGRRGRGHRIPVPNSCRVPDR